MTEHKPQREPDPGHEWARRFSQAMRRNIARQEEAELVSESNQHSVHVLDIREALGCAAQGDYSMIDLAHSALDSLEEQLQKAERDTETLSRLADALRGQRDRLEEQLEAIREVLHQVVGFDNAGSLVGHPYEQTYHLIAKKADALLASNPASEPPHMKARRGQVTIGPAELDASNQESRP